MIQPQAFVVDDYFIDIGVPTEYARAQQDLRLHL
jgi:NDP-sugar pyrophosphorylase family protein